MALSALPWFSWAVAARVESLCSVIVGVRSSNASGDVRPHVVERRLPHRDRFTVRSVVSVDEVRVCEQVEWPDLQVRAFSRVGHQEQVNPVLAHPLTSSLCTQVVVRVVPVSIPRPGELAVPPVRRPVVLVLLVQWLPLAEVIRYARSARHDLA